jgi:PAS domain S-box-containing protein
MQVHLLEAITRAQASFIADSDSRAAFEGLLTDLLSITESEYGFIGEVLIDTQGAPYLKTHAITNIAWNEETRAFYEQHAPEGLAFRNLNTLFGKVLLSAKLLISNRPFAHSERGRLPSGHPPLNAFAGVPILVGSTMVGMAGLANRAEGYTEDQIHALDPLLSTLGQLIFARRIQQARQASEHALEESEARYRALAEQSRSVTWEVNPEGLYTHVSDVATEVWGHSPHALVGKMHFYDLHPTEGREAFKMQALALIQAHHPIHGMENPILRPDGICIWVETHGLPHKDQNGVFLGYRGMDLDITKRKHAQMALQSNEARLRSLFEFSPVGIALNDYETGAFLEVNDALLAPTGYDREAFLALSYWQITPVDYSEQEAIQLDLLRKTGRYGPYEKEYIRKDGSRYPVLLNGIVITNPHHRGQRLIWSIIEDISERKAAEKALQNQAQHTQAILDNVLDGIITINERGLIQSFNQSAQRIFGYEPTEALGKNVSMLMPSPFREQHDTYLANYRATGVARIIGIGREVIGQSKEGGTFPLELSVSEIEQNGRPLYIGVVRDIRERKRIDRMKNEFVSTVSHELRTPLTSIAGALGLLAGGALGTLPPQGKAMIEIALKNSHRLTHLINDLLDMEKIAAGKLEFTMQDHALMPLVEQALEANKAYAQQYQVTLALAGRLDDKKIYVDAQRFMQIMSNFLSNACKFSPPGSRVTVRVLALSEGCTRVEVQDQGPGIPEDFRARLFQKFSQADSSDTRQKGGTGLGLAITKELAERMGGRVGLDANTTEGALFYIEFPLLDQAILPIPGGHAGGHALAPAILVVEDDPDIARLLALMLSRADYRVDIARDANTALTKLTHYHYDGITLDLGLPDMNGLELIRRIRQQSSTVDLPIIVVSARMEEGRLAINGDFSGIDWLAKPVDSERLLTSIRKAVPSDQGGRARVLHVEDDNDLHQVICAMVGPFFELEKAPSLAVAQKRIRESHFDVVILDLILPDGSGWSLLPVIREVQPHARVVILTGTDMTEAESRKVESALLKSHISVSELLKAIHGHISTVLPRNARS